MVTEDQTKISGLKVKEGDVEMAGHRNAAREGVSLGSDAGGASVRSREDKYLLYRSQSPSQRWARAARGTLGHNQGAATHRPLRPAPWT